MLRANGHSLRTILAGLALTALFAISLPGGCAVPGPAPIDPGTIGVTAGGQQDIAQARSQIDSGWVPDPAVITVEGFLSEHDIPITPPPNPPEIYGSAALAWRQPYAAASPYVDVFVSLGTTLDVATYQRRAQNLCVVVDRSGSMAWNAAAGDYRSKIEAVQQAIYALIDQLGADDQLSIVSFSDVARLDMRPTSGDQKEKLAGPVWRFKADGGTNLFEAMRLGFETLLASADDSRDNRLILLTDAQPTEGPTTGSEITAMQRTYADQGVGFTLLGVGQDYGVQLAREISQIRGGNAFFLSNADRVRQIFEEEFDYFVTPAAHDLKLQLNVAGELGIRDVYGVPGYTPGQSGAIVDIPTLFFSPREGGGAIVVRLTFATAPTFDQPVTVGQASMQYTLRDGSFRQLGQDLVLPAGLSPTAETPWFSEPTARRAALLLDTALVLKNAAQAGRDGRYPDGARLIRGFLDQFDIATLGMNDRLDATDRALSDERRVLERLLGTLD